MISAYAMRLVPPNMHGRAIAVVMAGSTLGLGVGLPVMTTIGTEIGWRVEFGVLAAIIFLIAVLVQSILPSVEGEKRTTANSPFYIIRNKSVVICLVVTFLTITAHYGLYTYIAPLVEHFNFAGGIKVASVIFGIGTILSVVIAARVIDSHLGELTIFMLSLALVTMFQAAVTKQVETGKDVATSLQSSTFNFGIVFGSAVGGALINYLSVFHIIYMTIALLAVSIFFTVSSKETFFK